MTTAADRSILSNMEDWLVTTIAATARLDADHVGFFRGSRDLGGMEDIASYLQAARSPYVLVEWIRSDPVDIAEGAADRIHTFAIYVCVQNPRDAASRMGESPTEAGTNLLQEQITKALHNSLTVVTATDDFEADQVKVGQVIPLHRPGGKQIIEMAVTIRAVPK